MSNLNRRILGVALRDIFSVTLDGSRWIEVGENPEVTWGTQRKIVLVVEPPEKIAQGSTVRLTLDLQRICGVCEIRLSDSVPPDA